MIGLGLGVLKAELDAMTGTDQDCLESMLSKWLKGIDPFPKWRALVDVLESKAVDEGKLAIELQERFCTTTAATPTAPQMQVC